MFPCTYGPNPSLASITSFAFFFRLLLKVFKTGLLGKCFHTLVKKCFKTCLLGRSFRTLINNVSFSSSIDVGSHNPPPFKAQRSRTRSFLQSMWDLPNCVLKFLRESLKKQYLLVVGLDGYDFNFIPLT